VDAVPNTPEPERNAADDDIFRSRWKDSIGTQGRELWERAGFTVAHHRVESDEEANRRRLVPVLARIQRRVDDGPAAGLPSLRWAIRTAAPMGPNGRRWGDWHFAQSLAASLRRLGQDAVVDNRESALRSSADLDEVNLVLRGLDAVEPVEGRRNLLWIISHPELVTAAELDGYDAVFAASTTWAASASRRWGVDVQPLLQCTDAHRFRPEAAEPDSGANVLFVGNSRGLYRPSVRVAMEAGVPLTVYGAGWEPFLPAQIVAGVSLPNERTAAAYAGARLVLNDHWDDMRADGFVSNRVFDVVATAGRLASDDVPGLGELFNGVVRTWTDPLELKELLHRPVEEAWPGRAERLAAAAVVASEHSFDSRARRLLDIALK
jgi:hypothetical protein